MRSHSCVNLKVTINLMDKCWILFTQPDTLLSTFMERCELGNAYKPYNIIWCLGFLKRNIKASHPQSKAVASNTLVRHQLKYAYGTLKNTVLTIKQIEMLQWTTARWNVQDYAFKRPAPPAVLNI